MKGIQVFLFCSYSCFARTHHAKKKNRRLKSWSQNYCECQKACIYSKLPPLKLHQSDIRLTLCIILALWFQLDAYDGRTYTPIANSNSTTTRASSSLSSADEERVRRRVVGMPYRIDAVCHHWSCHQGCLTHFMQYFERWLRNQKKSKQFRRTDCYFLEKNLWYAIAMWTHTRSLCREIALTT